MGTDHLTESQTMWLLRDNTYLMSYNEKIKLIENLKTRIVRVLGKMDLRLYNFPLLITVAFPSE